MSCIEPIQLDVLVCGQLKIAVLLGSLALFFWGGGFLPMLVYFFVVLTLDMFDLLTPV